MKRNLLRTVIAGGTFGLIAVIVRARMVLNGKREYATPQSLITPPPGESLDSLTRILSLDRGINFRDIGGYKAEDGRHVRRGLVYRSGDLSQLSEADLQKLTDLGLRLVCDLRTETELTERPDRLPEGVRSQHISVLSPNQARRDYQRVLLNLNHLDHVMVRTYLNMVQNRADKLGETLRLIADPANLPMAFHCSAGKDRTGITAALLLRVLGVPEETVLADYSLSNLYFEAVREGMRRVEGRLRRLRLSLDDLTPMLSADPATLRAALDWIKETYGSVEGYLLGPAGLDAATLARLREHLLE